MSGTQHNDDFIAQMRKEHDFATALGPDLDEETLLNLTADLHHLYSKCEAARFEWKYDRKVGNCTSADAKGLLSLDGKVAMCSGSLFSHSEHNGEVLCDVWTAISSAFPHPLWFWKTDADISEVPKVSGECVLEWNNRREEKYRMVSSDYRIRVQAKWQEGLGLHGLEYSNGFRGVGIALAVKKTDEGKPIEQHCLALFTLVKHGKVIGRYFGNPGMRGMANLSEIYGMTFHEDFFKDGPVRIHVKIVSGPHETYEKFLDRLFERCALLSQARTTEDLARRVKNVEFGMLLFAVLAVAFFIVYGPESDDASRRTGLLN